MLPAQQHPRTLFESAQGVEEWVERDDRAMASWQEGEWPGVAHRQRQGASSPISSAAQVKKPVWVRPFLIARQYAANPEVEARRGAESQPLPDLGLVRLVLRWRVLRRGGLTA